jgi:hypothetical protein
MYSSVLTFSSHHGLPCACVPTAMWQQLVSLQRSSGSLHENSMSNLYDSWRSEWNGYYYNAYYGDGNAGSSASGYSRRRSDYDTNFWMWPGYAVCLLTKELLWAYRIQDLTLGMSLRPPVTINILGTLWSVHIEFWSISEDASVCNVLLFWLKKEILNLLLM